jgi:hypothetical protein
MNTVTLRPEYAVAHVTQEDGHQWARPIGVRLVREVYGTRAYLDAVSMLTARERAGEPFVGY